MGLCEASFAGRTLIHPIVMGLVSEWHSRGQRFDPAYLHQTNETRFCVSFLFGKINVRTPLTSCIMILGRGAAFPAFNAGKVSGSIPHTTKALKSFDFRAFFVLFRL